MFARYLFEVTHGGLHIHEYQLLGHAAALVLYYYISTTSKTKDVHFVFCSANLSVHHVS